MLLRLILFLASVHLPYRPVSSFLLLKASPEWRLVTPIFFHKVNFRQTLASNEETPRGDKYRFKKGHKKNRKPLKQSTRVTKTQQFRYKEILEALETLPNQACFQKWLLQEQASTGRLRLASRQGIDLIRCLSHRHYLDTIVLLLVAEKTAILQFSAPVVTTALIALGPASHKHRHTVLNLLLDDHFMDEPPNSKTLSAAFGALTSRDDVWKWKELLQAKYGTKIWTRPVYHAALQACGRSVTRPSNHGHPHDNHLNNTWQVALQLFWELKRDKRSQQQPNAQTYTILVKVLAQHKQVRVALSLLQDVLVPPRSSHTAMAPKSTSLTNSPQLWGAALYACAQAGDYSQAMRLLQTMDSISQVQVNVQHVGALLAALAKSKQDDLAWHILWNGMVAQETVSLPCGPPLNNTTLVLPPVAPDLVAVNTVLDACSKADNYGRAKELLERLRAGQIVNANGSPMKPDVISYNTVLSACKDSLEAKLIVQEMRDSRRYRYGAVPPTSITYTHAITACRKTEIPDVAAALFLLDRARNDGVEPNVFMYSAAIWTAERAGDCEVALRLLEEMQSNQIFPNVVSYNGVISALAVNGRVEDALALWEEMKEKGIKPNKTTFQRLASSIRRAGDDLDKTSTLERIVGKMNQAELETRSGGAVLEALIRQYGSDSRYEDASRVFEMIQGPSDSYCQRAILYACSASVPPRWEEALSILHTSDIVEESKLPGKVDIRALSYAMLACAKADEWEEALNLAELYGRPIQKDIHRGGESNSVSLPAFNALIAACGRAGQPSVALRLLNDMESVFGIAPDERSYRNAMIACNQAEHDKRRCLRLGLHRQPYDDESHFQWWEGALSLLRRMKESGLQPDPQTYSSAISACEAAGQWQRALGVLHSMINEEREEARGNSRLNLYCFNAAVSACEKGGAWVEALELYYRMLDRGGAVTPNFVTLNSLLVALEKAAQKELAQSTYEDGVRRGILTPWKLTRAVDGGRIRAMDLHRFSAALAKAAVRSVLESLFDENPVHDVSRDLVIIVGKGKGSEDKPVLLSTVQNLLEEYGVAGEVDGTNAGRIVVASQVLQAFSTSRRWR